MLPAIAATFFLRLAASSVGAALQIDLADRGRAGGDVTATTLALLSVAFYAVELVGAPVLGARADRVGFRRFMLAGPVAGAVAALILQLPGHLVIWLLARAGQGLSTAASVPATLGYISAVTEGDARRRGRAMAFFEVATAVGLIGGLPLGTQLWRALGGTAYLLMAALCGVALGGFLLVRDRAAHPDAPAAEASLADRIALLRQPRVLTFAPAWLAVNGVLGVWLTHGIFQLRRASSTPNQWLMGSIGPRQLGLLLLAFGVTFLVGLLAWSWLLPRVGVQRALWLAMAGLTLATASIAAINHLPDPVRTLSMGLLVVGVLVESGFVPAALVRLAEIAEEKHGHGTQRGLVMGSYSLVLGLGQLLGAAIAAPFAQRLGIDGLVIVTAGLALVAGGALRLNLQSGTPQPAPGASPVD